MLVGIPIRKATTRARRESLPYRKVERFCAKLFLHSGLRELNANSALFTLCALDGFWGLKEAGEKV